MMTLQNDAKPILLATSLGDNCEDLLKLAVKLSSQLKRPLKVLHVVEPWVHGELGGSLGGMVGIGVVAPEVDKKLLDDANEKLSGFVENYKDEVEIQPLGLLGDPTHHILMEAESSYLTLVGVEKVNRGPLGFMSTVANVVARARRPVVVIPRDASQIDLDHPSILLADDLGEGSQGVSKFCFQIAADLKAKSLCHLHVTSLTRENLVAALDMAFAASHFPMTSRPDAQQVYDQSVNQLLENLQVRSIPFRAPLESQGCRYDVRVESGNPAVVLEKVRTQEKPMLEVYGKHHVVHTKPFSFGRVPLASMISGKSCVMIVPDEMS